MTLSGNFVFVGNEVRRGVKDPSKEYFVLALVQGTHPLEVFCNNRETYDQVTSCKLYSPVDLQLDYDVRYSSLRVTGIVK